MDEKRGKEKHGGMKRIKHETKQGEEEKYQEGRKEEIWKKREKENVGEKIN